MRFREYLLCLAAALSVIPAAHAMTLTELPAPPNDGIEIREQDCGKDCPALVQSVNAYLKGAYTVKTARYFRVDRGTPWVAVYKTLASDPKMKEAKDVTIDGHREGIDRVKVWKFGWLLPTYLATAVNAPQGDGTLVAYFELR